MSMSNSDSRKRLAETATPPAHPEFERFKARVLQNPEAKAAYEAAMLQDAREALALSNIIHTALGDECPEDPSCFDAAEAVLAAGYLPPAEVARLVQEARAEAWDEGWKVGVEDMKRWRRRDKPWLGATGNPHRPDVTSSDRCEKHDWTSGYHPFTGSVTVCEKCGVEQ